MFSCRDASRVLGVDCEMENASIHIRGASIDTRNLEPGNLFVALKGEKDDGHRYLETAFLKGASSALLEKNFFRSNREAFLKNPGTYHNLLPVDQPAEAFSKMAVWFRTSLPVKAVGITGSVGKTTTKEFLYHLLKQQAPVLANQGNFNNHLGLPLTLFRLQPSHRFCVAELGANHKGEIASLCSILKPEAGIITQVAPAHLEGFGSLDEVYRAKGELMEALPQGAPVVLPEEDPRLIARARELGLRPVLVGESPSADYRISGVKMKGGWVHFTLNERWKFKFPGLAAFLANNAAMAVAMAEALDFSCERMPKIWKGISWPQGRFQEKIFPQDIRIIDDSYNANPSSFHKALEAFHLLAGPGRKLVVLGDMLELGPEEAEYHEALGRDLARYSFDKVLGYGRLAKRSIESYSREKGLGPLQEGAFHFERQEELAESIIRQIQAGDRVLLKASRGMKMEKILEAFESKFGPAKPCQ